MKIRGYLYIFLSVILFYSMTLIVKLIVQESSFSFNLFSYEFNFISRGVIGGVQVAFFRFLTGMIILNMMLLLKKGKLNPKKYLPLYARGIFNSGAVILFFVTISYISTTKANIYNMTYPIFVTIFAPFILKDKFTLKKSVAVIIAFIGIILVSDFNFGDMESLGIGDIYGIAGGVIAGLAIVSLKKARETEDSFTILYFLMTIGTLLSGIIFFHLFRIPNFTELILLFLVGGVAFLGQFTITHGYKYVNAVEGSIISSTRIFLATIIGTLFLGEVVTICNLIGGVLIFFSIIQLNFVVKNREVKKDGNNQEKLDNSNSK